MKRTNELMDRTEHTMIVPFIVLDGSSKCYSCILNTNTYSCLAHYLYQSDHCLLFRAVLYRRSGGGVLDAGAGGAVRGERAGGVAEGGVLLLAGAGLGQPLPGVLRNITHSPSQHLTFWSIITSACSSLSKGSFKDHC